MLLVWGRISQKHSFLCAIWAVLGSQGIVVKCTAAIFFLTEDCSTQFLECLDIRIPYKAETTS